MSALHTVVAFVCALALLVFIHELGHFLVARWCGVKVLRFSLGFGPVLYSRRFGKDQTEWAVCAIPLGGYVKMLDEREGEVSPIERSRAFNVQALWKRFLIVLAGPVANFLLAIALYHGIFMAGSYVLKPQIGSVVAQSPAQRAGFVPGEEVIAMDGSSIRSWDELRWHLVTKALDGGSLVVSTLNGGTPAQRTLDMRGLQVDESAPDILRQVGLLPVVPQLPPVIGAVLPDGPAAHAGIQTGDKVLSVNGLPITHFAQMADQLAGLADQAIELEVLRGGQTVHLKLVPDGVALEDGSRRGRIGVGVAQAPGALDAYRVFVRYGPWEAFTRALDQTWEMTAFSVKVIGRMITGDVSLRNVSGPVTIADYAGKSASFGWEAYLRFLALISISLGTLNLLPVPVLDGGHLLYYLAEAIRGKPLSERVMEIGQRAGMALLAGLMVLALFNDIRRLALG